VCLEAGAGACRSELIKAVGVLAEAMLEFSRGYFRAPIEALGIK